MEANTVRLLISCPDKKGIVAAVASFLYENGANIIESGQYTTSHKGGIFFMRIEFEPAGFLLDGKDFYQRFLPIAEKFSFTWRVSFSHKKKRMAVFVTKEEHCLQELLWRWKNGELSVDIPFVISNHDVLRNVVEQFNLEFRKFEVKKDNREKAERELLSFMEGKVDFIVLARYMQILTKGFVDKYRNNIINIHHSFLPAFAGAKPYEQAYERGVKIIGATAHYVTEELDKGSIIEQDVARVSHRDDVKKLKIKGKDIERTVLFKAVKWHMEDRIVVYKNRTIVFV